MDTGQQYLIFTAVFGLPLLTVAIWLAIRDKRAKSKR